MIMREIVCTCSNAHIAGAALASIGGDFARDIALAARRRDMPPGVLVATLVKDFARGAAAEEWKAADQAARGADQPILSGLRFIVGASLRRQRQGTNAFRARHAEK